MKLPKGFVLCRHRFFDTTAFFVSLPFELFMFSSDLKWKEE